MARCTRCGAWNPDYVAFCGRCGGDVVKDSGEPGYPPAASASSPPKRICAWCGKEVGDTAVTCPFCGRDLAAVTAREETYRSSEDTYPRSYYPVSHHSMGPSGALTAGAIFAILAGVLAFGQGILYMAVGSVFGSYAPADFLCLCGALDFIFGIASIGAGVFSLKQENFVLCVIGAVLGMLGIGFWLGFVFGLVGLVLIAVSKEDFHS